MTVCGRIRLRVLACVALALGVAPLAPFCEAKATESHALAMHGAPALPPDFTHMPYANPDAPKGGRLVWGLLGTFDSLNPLIVRGIAVQQIRGFVVESLMARGNDEAFTLYGLLAKSVETDAPCGTPSSLIVHDPSSMTPAASHFWTSRRTRLSAIRCSRNLPNQP